MGWTWAVYLAHHVLQDIIDDVGEPLTNLRFADDIRLYASSRPDVKKMLAHVREEAAKYGLKMHMGKTKVLFNGCGRKDGPINPSAKRRRMY